MAKYWAENQTFAAANNSENQHYVLDTSSIRAFTWDIL
jgi:hypothetical protein